MKKEHSGSLAGRTETERVAGFSAISLIMDFPLSSVGDEIGFPFHRRRFRQREKNEKEGAG